MPGFPEVGLQAVLEGTGQFEKDAAGVSSSVTTLGNTVLKTAGIAAGIGVGAVAALGAGLVGLAGSALGPIGDFERMSASLSSLVAREVQASDSTLSFDEALQKAGPATKDLIGWVEQLAIISPFESKDVAAAMQMAMSFGLNTERAKELTSAEINWAAATGKGGEQMQRVSFALGKMNTQGKLNGEVLMQLAEAGVPANKILQELGYTSEDASKGLVPVDKFMNAVIADFNKFGSAAQAQANTWPGLISSLEDLKNIALREFFTGTFEAIKPYVVDFVTMLQDPGVRQWLKETGDLIGKTIAGAIQSVIEWIKKAKAWVDQFLPGLQDMLSGKFLTGAIKWTDLFPPWLNETILWLLQNLPAVKGALEGIGAVLVGAAGVAAVVALGGALVGLLNPITLLLAAGAALGVAWETNFMGMRDTLTAFWTNTAQPALADLQVWLQDNLPKAIAFISDIWENKLLPAFTQVSAWVTGVGLPALQKLAAFIWDNLVKAVQDISAGFTQDFLPALGDLKPIADDIMASFGEIGQVIGDFIKSLNFGPPGKDAVSFRQIVSAVFTALGKALRLYLKIFKEVVGVVADLLKGDFAGAWRRVQSVLKRVLDAMVRGLTSFAENLVKTISDALRDMVDNWKKKWESLKADTARLIQGIKDSIRAKIVEIVQSVGEAWESLGPTSKEKWENIKRIIAGVVQGIRDDVSVWLTTMISNLIKGWQQIVSDASSKWEEFKSTVSKKAQDAVKAIIDAISQLPGKILAFLNQMVDAGAKLIGGVITGIANKASDLLNQIAKTVGDAISSLSNSVTSGALLNSLVSIGQNILNAISSGIKSVTSFVWDLLGKIGSAISSLYDSIASGDLFNRLIQIGSNILNAITTGVKNATSFAWDLLGKVRSAITSLVDSIASGGLFNQLVGAGKAILDGLIEGIKANANAVAETLIDIIDAAIQAAKDALGITGDPQPSTYMEAMGAALMEGYANGILSQAGNVTDAMQASVSGAVRTGSMTLAPSLVAAPGLSGAGGGSSTTNVFNMGGNNITSGMDQAVFEARVLQVIRRNLR